MSASTTPSRQKTAVAEPATLEVWLRGPLADTPPLVQPVAHALLQAKEEVVTLLAGFPEALLWERPAGAASVGFHLQHLTGVLERLLTYTRGEALNTEQLAALAREGGGNGRTADLVAAFEAQVEAALAELRKLDERTLTEPRAVGRARLPSTVIGLLVHAAEHTTRHVGQLLVTVKVVEAGLK